jgi:hypothetical protein
MSPAAENSQNVCGQTGSANAANYLVVLLVDFLARNFATRKVYAHALLQIRCQGRVCLKLRLQIGQASSTWSPAVDPEMVERA